MNSLCQAKESHHRVITQLCSYPMTPGVLELTDFCGVDQLGCTIVCDKNKSNKMLTFLTPNMHEANVLNFDIKFSPIRINLQTS